MWLDRARGVDLRAEKRRVGYLPQDYALFPHLDVAGNVRYASRRERLDLLARVGIEHLAHVSPRELSGGERQRVALARALAREPAVLLLDEPFAALDPITRVEIRDQLADLLATLGLPTLIVTHSFEDAVALADRVGVLDAGQLVQLGTVSELLQAPASSLVAALTGANVLCGDAAPGRTGSTVAISGGGQLTSTATATGPVAVAIHPWELELVDPVDGSLIDKVVSIRDDHGRVVVRLERFTVHLDGRRDGRSALVAGETVGLRAAPDRVRLLAPAAG